MPSRYPPESRGVPWQYQEPGGGPSDTQVTGTAVRNGWQRQAHEQAHESGQTLHECSSPLSLFSQYYNQLVATLSLMILNPSRVFHKQRKGSGAIGMRAGSHVGTARQEEDQDALNI